MWFFPKAAVALVGAHSLTLVEKTIELSPSVEFHKENFAFLELRRRDQFIHEITQFLDSKQKKVPVIIVLSNRTVFYHSIPSTAERADEIAKEFFDLVPLPSDVVLHKTIKRAEDVVCLAFNHRVYEAVVEAFSQSKWKVEGVVPEVLLPKKNSQVDWERVREMPYKEKSAFGVLNLLKKS